MVFSNLHFMAITINHQNQPSNDHQLAWCNSLWLWRRLTHRNVSHSLSKTVLSRTTLTRTVTRQTFHSFTIFCVVTDIDECTTNAHDCHLDATCSNTGGSFTCSCNQGYSGDGKQCDGMFVILASRKRKIPCWPGCCGKGRTVWRGGGCQANIKVFVRYSKDDVI